MNAMFDENIDENQKRIVNDIIRRLIYLIAGNNSQLQSELKNNIEKSLKIIFIENEYANRTQNFKAVTECEPKINVNKYNKVCVNNDNSRYISIKIQNIPLVNHPNFDDAYLIMAHEMFHAITYILSNNTECIKVDDNNQYLAGTGGSLYLFERKNNTFERISGIKLGKFFNELTTDIISYIILDSFHYGTVNLDNFLRNPYYIIGAAKYYKIGTGYHQLSSGLGLLTLRAFENFPVDYRQIIKNGIFDSKYPSDDNEILFYNDLLEGVLRNPLHLYKCYEKVMGKSEWIKFCVLADKLIKGFPNNLKSDNFKSDVEEYIKILKKYFDNKIKQLQDEKKIDNNYVIRLKQNFNEIYYEVLKQFNININEVVEYFENNSTTISRR